MPIQPTADPALHIAADLIIGRRAASTVDANAWPQIVDQAERHGLVPYLYWTLRRQGAAPHDESVWQALARAAHHAAMQWALLDHALRDIVRALDGAGIPALWLKGSALAQTVYPHPALRPMGDLDVLVPFDQREAAFEVVRAIGYDFYTVDEDLVARSDDRLNLKLSYHYRLRGGPAQAVMLELHFRLLSYDDSLLSLDQLTWFWAQRRPVQAPDGAAFDTLSTEAHVLYLCAHALIQHGRDDFRLLRYFDLHLLITHGDVTWQQVADRAIELGWAPAVEEALRTCVEFFATDVPEHVLRALVQSRSALGVARVERMAGAGHRWERVRANLRALSFREAVAYAAQIVFPRPSYIRSRYSVAASKPVWPYYLRRWADHAREVAASTWKRLTGRYR